VLRFAGADPVLATTNASDDAAQFIRALIFSGELGPGEKLPSGIQLARRMGISVVTLRVALKSLESTGYIVTSLGAHGGSRVADSQGLTACWTRWMTENADQLDDIFELRTTIETRIAWLAAERRSASDLRAIETANELLAGPNPSVVPWNVAFHDAVARAAHSRHLSEAMVAVQGKLFLPVDLAKYEHRVAELRAAHAAILDGIREKAPEDAAEAMRAHLADTLAVFKRALARSGRASRRSSPTAGA
jgi:GntR family transcriptional regulator, transcriptional repressor for pyruvate dehydrogenase complex